MKKIQLKDISKIYGSNKPVIENLNLSIKEGSFTVLLGPSGCGKSTILRMIAGLEKESSGEIIIEGKSMKDVEPSDRNIAMVFQNYALYPTMTVQENIEFGLKNMGVPKAERLQKIGDVAQIVGLTDYLERKPQNLSGGQRQRVALARAIVKNPKVFLMDEPLSNLDAKLRNQIRTELIELYRKLKTTFIYVTHDQVEAMSMATDIILMDKGKIQQYTSPAEIYRNPANIFTAKFIGAPPMNIVEKDNLPDWGILREERAEYIGFRPEHAQVFPGDVESTEENLSLRGELITHEMLGDQIIYKVKTELGILQVKMFDNQMVEYGDVTVSVPLESIYYFDRDENLIGRDGKC